LGKKPEKSEKLILVLHSPAVNRKKRKELQKKRRKKLSHSGGQGKTELKISKEEIFVLTPVRSHKKRQERERKTKNGSGS